MKNSKSLLLRIRSPQNHSHPLKTNWTSIQLPSPANLDPLHNRKAQSLVIITRTEGLVLRVLRKEPPIVGNCVVPLDVVALEPQIHCPLKQGWKEKNSDDNKLFLDETREHGEDKSNDSKIEILNGAINLADFVVLMKFQKFDPKFSGDSFRWSQMDIGYDGASTLELSSLKGGIGWKSWKKRWFILTRTSLVFFKNDPGDLILGSGLETEILLNLNGFTFANLDHPYAAQVFLEMMHVLDYGILQYTSS
ncbi:Pleckstrin homology domain [Dillenia turbinata]|uniref:Pleckstrin homology domain n=1 Tax=Dillenia turbinata TaxID=194707 RepID=A0AAN8V2P0_9MAGN